MASYTAADLLALDRAIASAELEVELDGRRVRYRSMDELMRARAHVAGQLEAAQVAPQRNGAAYRYTFATRRGE